MAQWIANDLLFGEYWIFLLTTKKSTFDQKKGLKEAKKTSQKKVYVGHEVISFKAKHFRNSPVFILFVNVGLMR